MQAKLEAIARRLSPTPAVAVTLALLVLAACLAVGLFAERAAQRDAIHQAQVQADILAASLAAPLAFDDAAAVAQYVNALSANPLVEAAAAYDDEGRPVGGYQRAGQAPAPPYDGPSPLQVEGGRLTVTQPVTQSATVLGAVHLRFSTESLPRRLARYAGIAFIVIMASLMVAVLGASQANLARAHKRLREEMEQRETAEAALRQAQKMEAMGQLTGGVAHDFNNLLMVASSGLDLMERTDDPKRRARLKDGIRQAIDRGANLTQQLLAFSRKTPLKAQSTDLQARLAGMADVLERSLREDITVRVTAAQDLWPVELDASQFEVAILNMAINARDAMPDGGEIIISLENVPAGKDGAGDRVRVTVADTGEGMDEALASRVFEPFFTTKPVGKGTGLGLSQVYGFVRASGGEVDFTSQPGVGTKICMSLPRAAAALIGDDVAPVPSVDAASRALRVLLVEDDDRVADLVGEMLGELGHSFARAADAQSAIDMVATSGPWDVVFSDMVMPGSMGGRELARTIRERWPTLPVILTTGYSASAAAASADGVALLVKPYRIGALAAALGAATTQPA